ncbi:MAG: hypothetical protein ABIU97_10225, partial [Dehalococcoidia bacterium]
MRAKTSCDLGRDAIGIHVSVEFSVAAVGGVANGHESLRAEAGAELLDGDGVAGAQFVAADGSARA